MSHYSGVSYRFTVHTLVVFLRDSQKLSLNGGRDAHASTLSSVTDGTVKMILCKENFSCLMDRGFEGSSFLAVNLQHRYGKQKYYLIDEKVQFPF